LDLQKMLVNLY